MKFRASELVKRSASQLLYKELKRIEYQATPRQIKGNIYADEIVLKEEASSEKRGIIPIEEDLLFFCIDMVKDNKYIEIKMVENEDNYEDWYLWSSIVQSSFYATCLQKIKYLDTPKFRKKEGFAQKVIKVSENIDFELWFDSKQKFKIRPCEKLYEHYINKIKVIKNSLQTKSFDSVREFDSIYKFKEFQIFKPKYELI